MLMLHILSRGEVWRGNWHGTQVALKMLKKDGVVLGSDVRFYVNPTSDREITRTEIMLISRSPVKLT